MGKVIAYKNEAGGVFAQIQLESSERVLISLSTEDMSLKILKLLFGLIPIKVIYKASLKEATDLFLQPDDWGRQGALLDKIIETLKESASIAEIKGKIEKLKVGK